MGKVYKQTNGQTTSDQKSLLEPSVSGKLKSITGNIIYYFYFKKFYLKKNKFILREGLIWSLA